MRVVIVARQFGHSWSASAHELQARKWLHGPKTTVRGASASMQIVHRRRSSSASFSRLTRPRSTAVASVAALGYFFLAQDRTSCDFCALVGRGTTVKTCAKRSTDSTRMMEKS